MRATTELAHIRARAGLTQEELAKRAGLSVDTIKRIERGSNRPILLTQYAIAQALGMEREEVFPDAAEVPA
jgi:DNA-binding XRE family transcriptional regulator